MKPSKSGHVQWRNDLFKPCNPLVVLKDLNVDAFHASADSFVSGLPASVATGVRIKSLFSRSKSQPKTVDKLWRCGAPKSYVVLIYVKQVSCNYQSKSDCSHKQIPHLRAHILLPHTYTYFRTQLLTANGSLYVWAFYLSSFVMFESFFNPYLYQCCCPDMFNPPNVYPALIKQ